MNVHIIQHEVYEAPGAFLSWIEEKNFTSSFSRVFIDDPLPQSADNIDILIVMGGPQSPDTSTEQCPHFNAKAEITLIQKCIQNNKIVIGVCLGVQLIGEALGAKYEHSPEKEIGVWPIQLTADGLKDNNIKHFGTNLLVGHWHNDMPGLTKDCKILAQSIGCPRQIICYSDFVYGFQCHIEFTLEVVDLLINEEEDFLQNNTKHVFVQKPDVIRHQDFSKMNQKLKEFLDNISYKYQQVR